MERVRRDEKGESMSDPEQLYKQCATCHQFYPGVIGDLHDRCPAHDGHFKYTVYSIMRTRFITPKVYDVYWKDENGEYHRACRGCGKHMLKKNGKPVSMNNTQRCSMECYRKFPTPNWGETVLQFLYQLPRREIHDGQYTSHVEVQCQRCGEWTAERDIDIHHVKPVSLLGENELYLIWDFSNLMALCKACHNGDMHQEIYKNRREAKRVEEMKHWKVLIPMNKKGEH